jgi:uncharacterized membrane protein
VTVTWEVRLLFLQAAALFAFIGAAWIRGLPRYQSVWGLRVREAMASERAWRKVHREAGWVFVMTAAWLALPLQTLEMTTYIQIPGFVFLSFLGVAVVRYRAGT